MEQKLSNRLSALAEKATKGPWEVRDDVIFYASWVSAENRQADLFAVGEDWPLEHRVEAENTASLIVELVNALPTIIEALKAKDL